MPSASAEEPPFFFIQLSDPQLGMFSKNADIVQDSANLEKAVTAINRLKPAFVVITGDLVNRPADAVQIDAYRKLIGTISPEIPVHEVTGNHDIGQIPTPITIRGWENLFGPDHYSFRHGAFLGIVLNSTLISAPQKAPDFYEAQKQWLTEELTKAQATGAHPIVVFQHHSWFLQRPDEPDQYFNIPQERRAPFLALFHQYGVRHLFCGHLHRNALAHDAEIEVVTTGPVGKPLGDGRSGLCVAIVRGDQIEHHYYPLEEIPEKIDLAK
jgi:3',5'-cyclic AMP phosphodiesterase CpdA